MFNKTSLRGIYIAFSDREFLWSDCGQFTRYWLGVYLKESFPGRDFFDYLGGKGDRRIEDAPKSNNGKWGERADYLERIARLIKFTEIIRGNLDEGGIVVTHESFPGFWVGLKGKVESRRLVLSVTDGLEPFFPPDLLLLPKKSPGFEEGLSRLRAGSEGICFAIDGFSSREELRLAIGERVSKLTQIRNIEGSPRGIERDF